MCGSAWQEPSDRCRDSISCSCVVKCRSAKCSDLFEAAANITPKYGSQCSFVEHRNYKVIYRRYASLFFLVGIENDEVCSKTAESHCYSLTCHPKHSMTMTKPRLHTPKTISLVLAE